jgi:hypothetical protein
MPLELDSENCEAVLIRATAGLRLGGEVLAIAA